MKKKQNGSQPSRSSFPIVGIGASAGGLAAFMELLSAIPPNSGMAFVIVQHLDPTHTSMLGDALAKATSMKVATATDGIDVQPDHVYVIPPNADIALEGNSLLLSPREDSRKPHLAIDFFFRTLAAQRRGQAIGVSPAADPTARRACARSRPRAGSLSRKSRRPRSSETCPRAQSAPGSSTPACPSRRWRGNWSA
jgi:hypothetical protein